MKRPFAITGLNRATGEAARRPRVLMLLQSESGGKVARVLELLREAGVDPIFGTIGATTGDNEKVVALDVPSLAFGAVTSRRYPRACFRIARAIRRYEVDIVHGVEPIAATLGNLGSMLAGRGSRFFDRHHSRAVWPQNALSRVASRTADLVRVPSEAAREYAVAEDRVPRDKVRVVLNGAFEPRHVPEKENRQLRERLAIPGDAAVISTVGRLHPEKGIQVALEALSIVTFASRRPVHYVVAGDGPCAARLRDRATELGSPAHFVGYQSDVAPWFTVADLVWMPSFNEAFGIAAAEAMAARRPLIASAVGGLTEVVRDGETGFLVPPGDPAALARATQSLLAAPERLAALGAASRLRYEELFTVDRAIERTVDCYQELLGRPIGSALTVTPPARRVPHQTG
jgi:glycosyltransferase involved in cell wall biosynthesis